MRAMHVLGNKMESLESGEDFVVFSTIRSHTKGSVMKFAVLRRNCMIFYGPRINPNVLIFPGKRKDCIAGTIPGPKLYSGKS